MKENNKNKKLQSKKTREIDILAKNIQPFLAKTLVFVKKTRVKTWQGLFIIAFAAGIAAATVWIVISHLESNSKAAGEAALMRLDPASVDLTIDDPENPNETFDLDIVLDTQENNIVAVKAVVDYNNQDFALDTWDTSESSFAVLDNNECMQANNGQPCEKIENDPASGKISITLAKPTPGVNSHSATVASLSFYALRAVSPSGPNITINYIALGSEEDSDIIVDDGNGTDILGSVAGTIVSVVPEVVTCTDFIYSLGWGPCQVNNKQTRTVISGVPEGCSEGNPILEQDCIFVPPVCTSYTYSGWGPCQPDNTQSQTVLSGIPAGCEGGAEPELIRSCQYDGGAEECESFEYNGWGVCQINNKQTTTVKVSHPENCEGGVEPILEQDCVFVAPACAEFTYSEWSACQPDNTQSRTVASSSPAGCEGGSPVLTQSCTNPVVVDNSNDDDDDEHKSSDKTKPKFTDLPLFLNKKRGDKIWWKATDNKKVDHYTIGFAGIKRKIKNNSFIIPARISSGMHVLIVRAYDKAGNKATRTVMVRLR